MPVYDYLCASCGPFSGRRPMAEAGLPLACPDCAAPAPRMVTAPQLNLMSATRRGIDSRNEKSAHAPEVVHKPKHHESGHCGHGAGHAHGAHSHAAAHPPSRPWMIGH